MMWSETTTTSYWSPLCCILAIMSSVDSYTSSRTFLPVVFSKSVNISGSIYSEYMKTVTVCGAGGGGTSVVAVCGGWDGEQAA